MMMMPTTQLPPHDRMGADGATRTGPGVDAATPKLPPDAWGDVAKAALTAEGNSFVAWARLSLVSRAWRAGLKGAHSNPSPSAESVQAQIRRMVCASLLHELL